MSNHFMCNRLKLSHDFLLMPLLLDTYVLRILLHDLIQNLLLVLLSWLWLIHYLLLLHWNLLLPWLVDHLLLLHWNLLLPWLLLIHYLLTWLLLIHYSLPWLHAWLSHLSRMNDLDVVDDDDLRLLLGFPLWVKFVWVICTNVNVRTSFMRFPVDVF